jgi:HD-like signal output (HDOD) protein
LALLDDERASLGEIIRLIQLDAVFAAEVLRLANSAVLPLRFEVLSILHGVSVLGFSRIQSLVLTVALRDCLASIEMESLAYRCWRHNLASALACESLAALMLHDRPAAYTTGLLHDVGRLALVSTDARAYARLAERAARGGESLAELERQMFGCDSETATIELVRAWGLPQKQFAGLCTQSSPPAPEQHGLVSFGCRVARWAGFSITGELDCAPLQGVQASVAAHHSAAVDDRIERQLPEIAESVLLRLNLFECLFMPRCGVPVHAA